jgi:cell division protein FtsB
MRAVKADSCHRHRGKPLRSPTYAQQSSGSRIRRKTMRLIAAVAIAATSFALAVPAVTAADLSADVRNLQRSVETLQKQLDSEKSRGAGIGAFERRLADLEREKAAFGKSPIPVDAKISQIETRLNALDNRIRALEQAAGPVGGGATLATLGSRLDALEAKIQITGSTVRINAGTIDLAASAKVKASGGAMELGFGSMTASMGVATFTGVVKADTINTNSVISKTYTPGAGNVW